MKPKANLFFCYLIFLMLLTEGCGHLGYSLKEPAPASYVVSEHAAAISGLTKKKTVDSRDMEFLASLGFVVEQVPLLVPVS